MRLYLRLLYSDQAEAWRQERFADAAVVGVRPLLLLEGYQRLQLQHCKWPIDAVLHSFQLLCLA